MTLKEFAPRFVARMLAITGPTDGEGEPVEPYAREAAVGYFEDSMGMSPEECAEADVSYWEPVL